MTTGVVLAPTRELALQIEKECVRFGGPLGVCSACVYGGASREKQLAEVGAGVHAIIATPGRLNDFLETGEVRLDEADRMLDLGFEPQVQWVVDMLACYGMVCYVMCLIHVPRSAPSSRLWAGGGRRSSSRRRGPPRCRWETALPPYPLFLFHF